MCPATVYGASAGRNQSISFLFHGRNKTMKNRIVSHVLTAALMCGALAPLTTAAQSNGPATNALSVAATPFAVEWLRRG